MDSTSSTQITLKPCPFCGSDVVTIDGDLCSVECDCGAWMGKFGSRSRLIHYWNKRAAPSVSDGGSSDASRVSLQKQIESLLAACKAKDEALTTVKTAPRVPTIYQEIAGKALSIQPDSSVKTDEKDRELRWGEGEEFRKLAEKERDESRACLKLMLSVNGGFRLTAGEFERCQIAAGITGANRAGTMQTQ